MSPPGHRQGGIVDGAMPRLHRQGGIVTIGRQRQCRVDIAKAGASRADDASTSPRHDQFTAKSIKCMMFLSLTVHRIAEANGAFPLQRHISQLPATDWRFSHRWRLITADNIVRLHLWEVYFFCFTALKPCVSLKEAPKQILCSLLTSD